MKKIIPIIVMAFAIAPHVYAEPPKYSGMAPATASTPGSVQLSTDAEAVTGTESAKAVPPSGLSARLSAEISGKWDDTLMPVTAINPAGPDGSMTVDTTDILGALIATPVGNPSCFAIFQLPHMYKVGTDIVLHIHWVKNDGSDNSGTVPWQAKWRKSPINAVMDAAYTSYTAGADVISTGDVRYHHGITSWTIPSTGLNISSIIAVVVRRNGGTSGDAEIVGIDIHYQKGQQGSTSQTSL